MSIQVSIVIPSFNGKQLLRKNLPIVIKRSPQTEIVVVDDASTDGTIAFLAQQFPSVKVVTHKTNKRFAAACNSGVSAAKGELVVLLNNDVVPTKGYLTYLLPHFDDNEVFSVGCQEIEQRSTQQQKISLISGRTQGAFKRGLWMHWRPDDQESEDTLWTFGGSMAVDREKYLALGGMDELFAPAYWEDIDLCMRARKKGWKILFAKDAVVYHLHETTNQSVFGQRKMQVMAYRNQLLFTWRHMALAQWPLHVLWLPYHLVFTTLRSKGLFFWALWRAIWRRVSY